jgi:hypothetical protein
MRSAPTRAAAASHPRVGDVLPAQADVEGHVRAEEVDVLEHQADALAQLPRGDAVHRHAVEAGPRPAGS